MWVGLCVCVCVRQRKEVGDGPGCKVLTHQTDKVFCHLVITQGFLGVALALEILRPPLIELRVSTFNDVAFERMDVSFDEHPRHLLQVRVGSFVVRYGLLNFPKFFEMLRVPATNMTKLIALIFVR